MGQTITEKIFSEHVGHDYSREKLSDQILIW